MPSVCSGGKVALGCAAGLADLISVATTVVPPVAPTPMIGPHTA